MCLAVANALPETIELAASLTLSGGQEATVRGRLTGPAGAPVEIVLGGISSGRDACDHEGKAGWWNCQAGPGEVLDTDHYRLLAVDFAGGETSAFPTTHDQARALLALVDEAGIECFGVVGSSYGGMIALALAELAPRRVQRLLVISAAHRASAMAQAWRSIQRDTVELALSQGNGRAGLDLARRLAMTTYRTPEEIEARFYAPDPDSRDAGGVAEYLQARGRDFADRVTPERFLALSRSMDAHDVDVSRIECPVTYLAVIEDRLVPVEQIAEAAGNTPQGRLKTIKSFYGHDAFLKETAAISNTIKDYLED